MTIKQASPEGKALNNTQYPELLKAVALFYDEENAPTITAKGQGHEASEIVRLAQEHDVPLCENGLLVDLLSTLELGENIPERLYHSVAHIVAFAYDIRGKIPENFVEQTAHDGVE